MKPWQQWEQTLRNMLDAAGLVTRGDVAGDKATPPDHGGTKEVYGVPDYVIGVRHVFENRSFSQLVMIEAKSQHGTSMTLGGRDPDYKGSGVRYRQALQMDRYTRTGAQCFVAALLLIPASSVATIRQVRIARLIPWEAWSAAMNTRKSIPAKELATWGTPLNDHLDLLRVLLPAPSASTSAGPGEMDKASGTGKTETELKAGTEPGTEDFQPMKIPLPPGQQFVSPQYVSVIRQNNLLIATNPALGIDCRARTLADLSDALQETAATLLRTREHSPTTLSPNDQRIAQTWSVVLAPGSPR